VNAAVFIQPNERLHDALAQRKALVRARWPDAVYLEHPPHCTLIAGTFDLGEGWVQSLAGIVGAFAPFTVNTSGLELFTNDPMTGGTTVTIGVAESPALRQLQLAIASAMAPWRDREAAVALATRFAGGPAAESSARFGSPWIGSHWRPHFTVASPPVSEADLPPDLVAPIPAMDTHVAAVSAWRIEGERHTLLATMALGERGN
jgi:hypothetical protein